MQFSFRYYTNPYIGRPSKWGNPFTHLRDRKTQAQFVVASREDAVTAYRAWIVQQPALMASLAELRGQTLGCWCKPRSCHGDVLAELADALGAQTQTEIGGL